jgi:hypothetical protein
MAKETVTKLIDDLDGTPADSTIRIGLEGVEVDLDLNTKNEHTLRAILHPYLEVARRVRNEGARRRPGSGPGGADKDRNRQIRQWSLDSGVELPSRGRIAGAVQRAYDAKDVAALFAAAGLEMEPEQTPKRGRRRAAEPQFAAAG